MLKVKQIRNDIYSILNGKGSIRREYGETPAGNAMNGRWVFRDENGRMIDYDQYRHDLFERHDIEEDHGSN